LTGRLTGWLAGWLATNFLQERYWLYKQANMVVFHNPYLKKNKAPHPEQPQQPAPAPPSNSTTIAAGGGGGRGRKRPRPPPEFDAASGNGGCGFDDGGAADIDWGAAVELLDRVSSSQSQQQQVQSSQQQQSQSQSQQQLPPPAPRTLGVAPNSNRDDRNFAAAGSGRPPQQVAPVPPRPSSLPDRRQHVPPVRPPTACSSLLYAGSSTGGGIRPLVRQQQQTDTIRSCSGDNDDNRKRPPLPPPSRAAASRQQPPTTPDAEEKRHPQRDNGLLKRPSPWNPPPPRQQQRQHAAGTPPASASKPPGARSALGTPTTASSPATTSAAAAAGGGGAARAGHAPPSPLQEMIVRAGTVQNSLPVGLRFDPNLLQPSNDGLTKALVKNAELSRPLLNGWKLYDHQKKALLLGLRMRRAILALDMGTGKTLIGAVFAKAFIRSLPDDDVTVIVVCPVSLKEEWKRTVENATGLGVVPDPSMNNDKPRKKTKTNKKCDDDDDDSDSDDDEDDEAENKKKNVVIVSWNKIPKTVPGDGPYVIIADEAHSMQSMGAQRTNHILQLTDRGKGSRKRCVAVLLLTGTPMKVSLSFLLSLVLSCCCIFTLYFPSSNERNLFEERQSK